MPTYTFTPPLAQIVPPYLADTKGLQYLLYRYAKPTYRGVNVYVLSNGTVAQDYPTPENSNTNYPLPWNPSNPSAPFSTVTNFDGTTTSTSLPVYIVNIYQGGHIHTISDEQATFLSANGYANCITVTP